MTAIPLASPPNAHSAAHGLGALLERQRAAFATDPNPSYAVRLDRLSRLEQLLERDEEALAQAIASDFGTRSPVVTTITETLVLRAAIRHARRHLKAWMKPRRVATSLIYRPGRALLMRQPLGVIGIVGAWNYPLLLTLSPLIDVLAAGNRAMLKPSELTPAFAAVLKSRIEAVFAPEEVAVVIGDAEVGRALSALPFDHLVFTGATNVGRQVARAAATNLTPVTLELGGKSPAIIDVSADLPAACTRLMWGKLMNAGQTCVAPDYALVPRGRLDDVVTALQAAAARQYPAIAPNADYTSIVNERHFLRLRGLIDDARSRGARAIEINPGGETVDAATRKLPPTLLLDVDDDMRVMQEEIFGPILPIVVYDSLDAAIAYINRRERPLSLYWFGTNAAHRDQVLTRTISGGVVINDTMLHVAQDGLPFGGVGASGHGHYHGEFGFRQFSKEKPVFIQSRFSGGRRLYPPYTTATRRLLRLLLRWA